LAPYAWEFDSEQALFYPNGLASGKTWADCWDEKQKAYVGGQNLTCYQIRTRSIDLGSVQAAGTKITWSWKHKGYLLAIILSHSLDNTTFTEWNSENTLEFKGDSSFNEWGTSSNNLYFRIDGKRPDYLGKPEQLLDRWYDIEITYTLPTDARYIQIKWDFNKAYQADGGRGVKGYIHKPQLEVKPFASSFVVGSRPNGRLVIPVEDLKFDIANDDWVISYWKYPVATNDDAQNGYNLCSLGEYTSDFSLGYIYWGKEYNSNVFVLEVALSDSTIQKVYSFSFDPNWYFKNWHYEVIIKK